MKDIAKQVSSLYDDIASMDAELKVQRGEPSAAQILRRITSNLGGYDF